MPSGKVITAEDRQVRLPWWGVICVIFGTVLLGLLFLHFGRFDLARPSIVSAAMVAIAVALRWKLRRHLWFWVTVTILAALHLPLIFYIPWTTRWVPAFVIAPFAMADLYAMLWLLSVIGKFAEDSKTD